jgi:hypothetical protein
MLQIILILNTIYCELILFPIIKMQDLLERCIYLFQKIYEDKFYHPDSKQTQILGDIGEKVQIKSNHQEIDVLTTVQDIDEKNLTNLDFNEKEAKISERHISKDDEETNEDKTIQKNEIETETPKGNFSDNKEETKKVDEPVRIEDPKIFNNKTYFISHKWVDVESPYDVAKVELKEPYFLDCEDIPQSKYILVTNYDMFKGKGIHDREAKLDEITDMKMINDNYTAKILWNENKTIFINSVDGSSFDVDGLYVIVKNKLYMTSKMELKEHLKILDVALFEFNFYSTLTNDQIDTFFTYYEHKILFVFWYKILFLLTSTIVLLILDIIFLRAFLVPLIIIILVVMGLQLNKDVLFKDEVTEHVFLNIKTFFLYFFSTFGLTAIEFNTKKRQHGDVRKFILRCYFGIPGLLLLPLNVTVFSVSSYIVIVIQIYRASRNLCCGGCYSDDHRNAINELRHYIRSTGLLLV